jgi:hypothetical protein
LLLKCLASISEYTNRQTEVIIVDNASQKDELELSVAGKIGCLVIRNQQNQGFAKANNLGIAAANGEYIVLLNPDTELKNEALDQMAKYLQDHPDTGVVGPKVLNADSSLQASARKFPSISTVFFGRSTFLTKLFPNNVMSKRDLLCADHNSVEPLEVDWVSGACLMTTRKAMEKVGLLDEEFFMYWEDADWCKRFKARGFKVVWLPSAEVYHLAGESSKQLPWKTMREFNKSVLYYYKKHYRTNVFLDEIVIFGLFIRGVLKIIGIITMSLPRRRESR